MNGGAVILECARRVVGGAAETLDRSRDRIDDLNVYPVPDGDTGSNLALSFASVRTALEAADAPTLGPELAATTARAALVGARGNSGIILSQIVRGLVTSLGAEHEFDSGALARALRAASDVAYAAVPVPVEGTMLTVARDLAEAAETTRERALAEAFEVILAAGEASLERTTELLPALAEAGVVDAGGAGLIELLRGAVAGYEGVLPGPRAPALNPVPAPPPHPPTDSRFRYCTNVLVLQATVLPSALERELEPLGDCLVVVSDGDAIKVHLHTDDPGQAISLASAVGSLADVDVTDMRDQMSVRAARWAGHGRHLSIVPESEDASTSEVLTLIARTDDQPAVELETATTGIVYDSTADLDPGAAESGNWAMVPLIVRFGDESFRDYEELDARSFYRRLDTSSVTPSTSQPSPAAFAEVYERELERFEQVLSVHLAGTLSGTVESARLAAKEFGGRVHVRDSGTVSIGLATRIRALQEMLDAGTTIEAVDRYLSEAEARTRIRFAVGTLSYLQRGGRIGRGAALLGSILSLKPITALEHGAVVPIRNVRGEGRVIPALLKDFEEFVPRHACGRLAITHSACPERAEALRTALLASRGGLAFDGVSELGPVVGTHAGPGTIAWAVELSG